MRNSHWGVCSHCGGCSLDFLDGFQNLLPLLAGRQLGVVLAGILIGTLVAEVSQLRAIHAVALFLPLTYTLNLPVESTLILLLTIYYSASFGRPNNGEAVEVNSCLKKRYAKERFYSGTGSFVGGIFAISGLLLLVAIMEKVAVRFAPGEYFFLVIFALATLSLRAGQYPVRTLLSGVLGLMIAAIGIDPTTGVLRFTFNEPQLYDGIEFSTIVVGLFVISQILTLLLPSQNPPRNGAGKPYVHRHDSLLRCRGTLLRSALAGFFIGILPGVGASIASSSAAQLEKRILLSRTTSQNFTPRTGLASETANTAAVGGAMAPLLALGIPGSGTAAIMLGALLLHNISPGPGLFTQNTELVWSLAAALAVTNLILLFCHPILPRWLHGLGQIPLWVLAPTMTVLAFVGVYSVNKSSLSLLIMLIIGGLGYLLERWKYPLVPLLLGFVLGDLMENNLRRALAISGGDWKILFASPTSQLFCTLSFLVMMLALFLSRTRRFQTGSAENPDSAT